MSGVVLDKILPCVVDSIGGIDQDCRTIRNGIEHGLVNVKLEFQERALHETGKKMGEERIIAWLLCHRLSEGGWNTKQEVAFPAKSRKKCDLVVDLGGNCRLWIEIKIAWKAWYNCTRKPDYSNPFYCSYLEGCSYRTHSFRDDLCKLCGHHWQPGDYRAVCLVGFDWCESRWTMTLWP